MKNDNAEQKNVVDRDSLEKCEVTPQFSLICATYNRMDKLPRAIKSALNQSFKRWELIVIDDGSTDGTAKIIQPFLDDPRIRYFSFNVNKGVGYARNFAIKRATAEWIVIHDSDNVILPDALEYMFYTINNHQNYHLHKFCTRDFSGNVMCEKIPGDCAVVSSSEYLCGRFKGEYFPLVKKDLLLSNPFFEDVNGGEGVVWTKIALQSGSLLYHSFFTQIYDTEGDDRLSLRSKNYKRIMRVHKKTVKQLWREYLKTCPGQLIIICGKVLTYYILVKMKVIAQQLLPLSTK